MSLTQKDNMGMDEEGLIRHRVTGKDGRGPYGWTLSRPAENGQREMVVCSYGFDTQELADAQYAE
jgi:hypothetical protein